MGPFRAQKRGGSKIILSLDDDAFRESDLNLNASQISPEDAFDRQWMRLLLKRARENLRNENDRNGDAELFDDICECLMDQTPRGLYAEIAAKRNTTKAAIAKFVQRQRERMRVLLRVEVAETVSIPTQVDEELKELQQAMNPTS